MTKEERSSTRRRNTNRPLLPSSPSRSPRGKPQAYSFRCESQGISGGFHGDNRTSNKKYAKLLIPYQKPPSPKLPPNHGRGFPHGNTKRCKTLFDARQYKDHRNHKNNPEPTSEVGKRAVSLDAIKNIKKQTKDTVEYNQKQAATLPRKKISEIKMRLAIQGVINQKFPNVN